jgi:hypothetical protein
MECHEATAHIADYLAGTLQAEELEALRAHAAACAACRNELTAAEETWQHLGNIPAMDPDVLAMRMRFDAMISGDASPGLPRHGTRSARWRAALAAAAMLLLGIAIGRQTASPASPDSATQIAALRTELGEMRQMMSLSLLQQQSATARLQGVVSTGQIDDPGADVIAALLDTLMFDPNPNVRLATIDALNRFMNRDLVRRKTLDALPRQTSPLVQIALIDFVAESAGPESADALRTLSENSTVEDAVRRRASERLREVEGRS